MEDLDYRLAEGGNVVQTGRTRLSVLAGAQHLTLSLGFGATTAEAAATASGSPP